MEGERATNMPVTSARRQRKRGRHAAACSACQRRKQKCNGSQPCFNCSHRGVATACTYSEEVRQRQGPFITQSPIEAPGTTSCPSHTHVGTLRGESNSRNSRLTPEPRQPQLGNLFRSRDAPSFFGSSYFGPQVAAKIIEAPAPDLSSGIRHSAGSVHSFRDVGGPFSQIWDLLGLLPRDKHSVDRLVEVFLRELNWCIDALHEKQFKNKYDLFWERKFGFDDFATIDLRWLALLFIVLAYGVLLDCPNPENVQVQLDLQETSLRFYWAARRAIVIAPTFYGESTDLVRAGVLVTRYLIHLRRVPESWLTTSFAMRMAQAQGMHVDGTRFKLDRKETETRRRLWSHLYMLDKTIALAIGRPFAIVDQQCLVRRATNVWLDDEEGSTAERIPESPRSAPTRSMVSILAHDLSQIVGRIQEHCFGLFAVSYDKVISLDKEVQDWANQLPPYFLIYDADTSLDDIHPFLYWNRQFLKSLYHFTRVTLHRPYLLRHSITDRFKRSHDACIESACADLAMRMDYLNQSLQNRLKWALGPHHLFNSALVLGIIAVKQPHSQRSHAILEDLAAYCEISRADIWLNEFALAEIKIVELCITKVNDIRQTSTNARAQDRLSLLQEATGGQNSTSMGQDVEKSSRRLDFRDPGSGNTHSLTPNQSSGDFGAFPWQTPWPDASFLEPTDLQQWELILDSITQEQMASNFQP